MNSTNCTEFNNNSHVRYTVLLCYQSSVLFRNPQVAT